MGLGSGIQDPEKIYSGSRIQGSKRHRTSDPQHWKSMNISALISWGWVGGCVSLFVSLNISITDNRTGTIQDTLTTIPDPGSRGQKGTGPRIRNTGKV